MKLGRSALLMRLKLAVVPMVGAGAIRMLGAMLRCRTIGAEHVDCFHREGRAVVIAFWHGRQLLMPLAYRGKEAHVLISQHRDGELIRRIVARFGLQAVRGSTTRGGAVAFRQLVRLGRSGKDLVVTPDGPKGPRQVAQLGVVHLAKATNLPILPLTFSCSKKKSSAVGIASSCPVPSGAASLSGASRSMCRRTRPSRKWSRSAPNWSRC